LLPGFGYGLTFVAAPPAPTVIGKDVTVAAISGDPSNGLAV
jgi:hypothetical protein